MTIYWIYSNLVLTEGIFEIGIFVTAADEKRDPRYRGQAVNRLIPDIYIMELPYSDLHPGGIFSAIGYWCWICANRFDRRSRLDTSTS